MASKHIIEVTSVPCQCGTPGHVDLVVVCSCGLNERLNHGRRDAASSVILYHRISAIEEELGIKLSITWKSGT